jgi:hypothetical protein
MSVGGEEKKAGFLDRVAGVFRRDSRPDAVELVGNGEPNVDEALLLLMRDEQEALQESARQAELLRQAALVQQFPRPQCSLAMGVTTGNRRTVLTAADVRPKAPEAMAVDFVNIVDPMAVDELIKEREALTGVDLKQETIDAERAMDATLDRTIPRLHRELTCAYNRKREYTSKRVHWEWAEELRGQAQNSCRVDRTLKKSKKPVDAQQAAADKAFAERRKLEAEMVKLQDRMRKAAEDEQRARTAAH